MSNERKQQDRRCLACNAIAFADSCLDSNLRDAILAFAPPHTCSTTRAQDPDQRAQELDALKVTDIIAFNYSAEKAFVALVKTLTPCTCAQVLAESAFELNISIETARRYLLKHTARRAEFEIHDDIVFARSRNVVR